jgi:uncharacterized membrane protein
MALTFSTVFQVVDLVDKRKFSTFSAVFFINFKIKPMWDVGFMLTSLHNILDEK